MSSEYRMNAQEQKEAEHLQNLYLTLSQEREKNADTLPYSDEAFAAGLELIRYFLQKNPLIAKILLAHLQANLLATVSQLSPEVLVFRKQALKNAMQDIVEPSLQSPTPSP